MVYQIYHFPIYALQTFADEHHIVHHAKHAFLDENRRLKEVLDVPATLHVAVLERGDKFPDVRLLDGVMLLLGALPHKISGLRMFGVPRGSRRGTAPARPWRRLRIWLSLRK
ncbi:MAG: hypothetical protein KUL86_10455 [Castellaniella sp.]|nr:hypothetical protein [Castellaniella sp.]